jgi:MarR family transcriptional regulator, transcriptional regulator for hemolysin
MHESLPVRRTLGFLMRDAARLMRRRFVQRAREVGLPLNRSEASVLVAVNREPGLSQAQLAARLDMEAISLVRLIDSLQVARLIERRPHSHDRRIRTLWLTEAAQPILAQVRAVAAEVREQAMAGISEARREKLRDLLLTVRTNMATQTTADPDAEVRPAEDGTAPPVPLPVVPSPVVPSPSVPSRSVPSRSAVVTSVVAAK